MERSTFVTGKSRANDNERHVPRLFALGATIALLVAVWTALVALANAGPLMGGSTTEGGVAPVAPVAGAAECDPGWQVSPSANTGDESTLRAIATVSSSDAWAVGYYFTAVASRTLIEHWNGSTWTVVPSPNISTGSNYLEGVDALSANDVWAAGFFVNGSTKQTLLLHWNGSAWSVSPSANAGSNDNYLYDVKAVTANDAWAVGYYLNATITDRTLILRWNGSTWTVVPSPNIGTGLNDLEGITALAANDVWAVGSYSNGSTHKTLTLHWDGTSWTTVASPNQGAATDANYLYGVKAISASDVWAAGAYRNSGTYQTLMLHWNGSAWSIVPSPNLNTGANALFAIAAVSTGDVWAVGYYASGTSIERTLTEHWDGNTWSIVPSPNSNTDQNRLYGVAVVHQDELWAAGYSKQTVFQTLTEHYTCSVCTVQFTDVPQGSTYYDFVRCMACRGIISGYSDNTFRPNANVTRGQLAKIVANAAGFVEPVGAQQYEDVPPGSAFYDFVWRLANRGYIGGYACGGAGEPCVPPANLPYFRPNKEASRGQISKIVSNAAGFSDTPAGQQFEDVAAGSTYYAYTYRLVSRAIMSGYPCGGAGEPCVPPANLPYFRPNYNATRGQTAKIVSNTFFPNCQTGDR